MTKQQVRGIAEGLLTTKQLVVDHAEMTWKALHTYGANHDDFSDALIVQANIHGGCEHTVIVDRNAASLPGFDLLR